MVSRGSRVARGLLVVSDGAMMDFWYELAIRELADLNEELLREAEEASRLPSPEPADEENE
jgi:hypothetical protein